MLDLDNFCCRRRKQSILKIFTNFCLHLSTAAAAVARVAKFLRRNSHPLIKQFLWNKIVNKKIITLFATRHRPLQFGQFQYHHHFLQKYIFYFQSFFRIWAIHNWRHANLTPNFVERGHVRKYCVKQIMWIFSIFNFVQGGIAAIGVRSYHLIYKNPISSNLYIVYSLHLI